MKSKMNTLTALPGLLLSCLLLIPTGGYAALVCPTVDKDTGDYNPFLVQGIVSPAPLLPVEFNGTGTVAIDVGNTGGDPLCLISTEEMGLIITLSKGVPNNLDPIAAIGGDGKAWFSWAYNSMTRTYTATQSQEIPADSQKTITISYDVTENSFLGSPSNGFNINLQPPDYSTGSNAPGDDNVSSYTYVEAFDYGDVPLVGGDGTAIYGSAEHEIDLTQDTTPGQYDRYIYLGSSVDPEDAHLSSENAALDDFNFSGGLDVDDEDGVAWPPSLDAGVTTSVPVTATLNGFLGVYFIQFWVDWGKDGTFDAADEGAYVLGLPGSSPTPLQVAVPAGTPDGYYYARVRINGGLLLGPNQSVDNGEVEDYLIIVGTPTAVTIGSVNLEAASVTDFLNDLGVDQMGTMALRDILKAWDSSLAASAGADRDAILNSLKKYLDPDGDEHVAVLHWDTLEERGTVGFYVKRSDANGMGEEIINNDMLPGLITAPMGGEYMLADPVPTSGNTYQYRFIEKEASGNTREYGPYVVEMPQ